MVWFDEIIEEDQLVESKEDSHLILRGFFINRINEIYNKFRDRDMSSSLKPLSHRLGFCLTNNLIPYMNINDKSELLITSDIIQELRRNKVDSISSLAELSTIVDDFQYGQKKLAGKNLRTASGSLGVFMQFLGENEEINTNEDSMVAG